MRRLTRFACAGEPLGATLDDGAGQTGILIVTGGGQTRIGSHRMFERLGHGLAANGFPNFRYDRRGVGDSGGIDPGWRGSGPDLAAAAAAFRAERKGLERMIGLGLCDGASALALHGAAAGLTGIILVNPWMVEAEAGAPPPAAIRDHYRRRLASLDTWRRLARGGVSLRKLGSGVKRMMRKPDPSLGEELGKAIAAAHMPAALVLAGGDATAIAAAELWAAPAFAAIRAANAAPYRIESDSHTFARDGDEEALLQAVLTAIQALSRRR